MNEEPVEYAYEDQAFDNSENLAGKLTTPRYHFYLCFASCRGIVTADVLELGLSRGAIATRKLKGVKRDKGHEDYTGSASYGEGKSLLQLRWNYLGFR